MHVGFGDKKMKTKKMSKKVWWKCRACGRRMKAEKYKLDRCKFCGSDDVSFSASKYGW